MKHLHEYTLAELDTVRELRQTEGTAKYGEKHLQRDGAIDVAEELMDALNIAGLMLHRYREQKDKILLPRWEKARAVVVWDDVANSLDKALVALRYLSKVWPEELLTDEQGGDRSCWGVVNGE